MNIPALDNLKKLFRRAWLACKAWLRDPYHLATAIGAFIWLLFALEWLWGHNVGDVVRWIIFSAAALGAGAWLWCTRRKPRMLRAVVASLAIVPLWQWSVFATDKLAWSGPSAALASIGLGAIFLIGLAWTVYGVERGSSYYRKQRDAAHRPTGAGSHRAASTAAGSALAMDAPDDSALTARVWNPVDLDAWYYGKRSPRLNQSVTTILTYSVAFFLLVYLFNLLGGCQEIYEMPAGGGEELPKVQVVKIQKVIRKKFVINPLNKVVMAVPPIEEVQLNLNTVTKHEYQIGQGKGTGAGFSGGTFKGKVRFIRLEYRGGDWDQDMGVGADLNMLIEYHARTGHQVHNVTESRTIEELSRFPIGKSPPVVYMTGQRSIELSKREVEVLREYLLDKHGMIFADNGGSRQWDAQFFAMMKRVLEGTGVYPVKVPLDDQIHRVPFTLPFLPYVAPHGGKDAWGWYKDGRWLAYYHPGDIGDAWSDGHAGVRREIYEACYQLGVNVIFYGHAEYNKWLESREKKE